MKVVSARVALTVERLWQTLWPTTIVLTSFLIVTLLGLWERLPIWLHMAGLALFAGAVGYTLWRARAGFLLATPRDGLARLERDSAIPHRALQSLEDQLPEAVRDPATRALWQAHRQRLTKLVGKVKVTPPRSALPRIDRWAFRALLMLLLVVSLVDAQGRIGLRLLSAFVPTTPAAAAQAALSTQVWIIPPPYTRLPPMAAEQIRASERLVVPTGSEVLVQLHHLQAEGDVAKAKLFTGAEEHDFVDLGAGSAEVKAKLITAGRLAIQGPDGRELAGWPLELTPDQPPTISFVETPKYTHRGVLRIAFEASDDYGISEIALELAPEVRPEETERLPLQKPSSQPGKFASASYTDLLAHPYAGLPVVMRLLAVDGIGQEGASAPLKMTLPERQFKHPLARAVIEQRKLLVAEPGERDRIAGRIAALGDSKAAMDVATSVPLSLRIAAIRTRDAETRELRRGVVDLLWEIALFIEDGSLSTAEKDLRALQDRLQQALEDNASDAELEQLLRELQQALDRFLDELTRQAMENAQRPDADRQEMQPVDPSQMVERRDLQEMLNRAREMMKSGQRDAAKQMLSQLREMLENLQSAMGQQQQSPQQKSLSDLQKMMQLQQNLLDRSHKMQQQQEGQQGQQEQQGQQGQQGRQGRQAQQGRQPGQQGQQRSQRGSPSQRGQGEGGEPENALPDSPGRAMAEQDGLRRALGELMRRMGEQGMQIPRALGQAELEMREAKDALGQDQPGEATDPQGQALDLMAQGGQAMLEQMQQQAGQQPGQEPGPGGEPLAQGRRGRDPLGRSQFNDGGWDPTGELVPDEADLGRARDVLQELHRRSGERLRPPLELDYYKRLLERF